METKQLGPLEEWSVRLARPSPGQHAMRLNKTKVAALPRSYDQDDGSQRPGGLQEIVGENQRCEDNSCSAARYSPPSSNLLREMVKGTDFEQSC